MNTLSQKVSCLLLLVTLSVSVGAQEPAAPPDATDSFQFTSGAALILWQIQPDKAADFELVWRVIRQRADAVAGADVRALVAGITIYAPGVRTGDSLTYVFHIDPVVKGSSYSPTGLLFGSNLFERAEADELFAKMNEALMPGNSISTMPLNQTP